MIAQSLRRNQGNKLSISIEVETVNVFLHTLEENSASHIRIDKHRGGFVDLS